MLLGNGVPFMVLTYAAAYLGAITVPLNTCDQKPGNRHALLNSQALALVVEAQLKLPLPQRSDRKT